MKKLFFLLLTLMLGVGMVFAVTNPVHQPGAFDSDVLAEISVQQDIFTQPTVLVMPNTVDSSFQVVLAYDNLAVRPQYDLCISISSMIYFSWVNGSKADYYLQC
jgi:hypothetical protein